MNTILLPKRAENLAPAASSASPEIFAGLVGRVVSTFEPYTEADPVGIAAQFLVAFGSAAGRNPHVQIGETRHHLNEFVVLVGASSHARKGDSLRVALRTVSDADADWRDRHVMAGLSSGEGLIYAVRDEGATTQNGWDAGVTDKRLLVTEPEFSKVLIQGTRSTNILSVTLREAWDGQRMGIMTRANPLCATGAHISLIGHTTPADLVRHLTKTDAVNGFANRFILIGVRRVKILPDPGQAADEAVREVADKVRAALDSARCVGAMRRSSAAEDLWAEVYPMLTRDQPGLPGQLLARSEAHVLRLSALYALSAQSAVIEVSHLRSALALWDHAERSVHEVFAATTGNSLADTLLQGLPEDGTPQSHTEIRSSIFANHISARDLTATIAELKSTGAVVVTTQRTGGRPAQYVARALDHARAESVESVERGRLTAETPTPDGDLGERPREPAARADGGDDLGCCQRAVAPIRAREVS